MYSIVEYNEIYNSILKEFQLSSSILEKMKISVEVLSKSRIGICKLLKIQKFKAEIIDLNRKEIIMIINMKKSSIENYEEKQIELRNKIKTCKSEIKVIKFHLNKLEDTINKEQQESRELRESLEIFVKREKFKFIKKIFIKKYIKVFNKYSNKLSIKTKIYECNKRKEKLRKEKQNFNYEKEKNNKKINSDKITLSEMRKKIVYMKKCIELLIVKIDNINEYIKIEKKFRVEILKYNKLDEKSLT